MQVLAKYKLFWVFIQLDGNRWSICCGVLNKIVKIQVQNRHPNCLIFRQRFSKNLVVIQRIYRCKSVHCCYKEKNWGHLWLKRQTIQIFATPDLHNKYNDGGCLCNNRRSAKGKKLFNLNFHLIMYLLSS